MYSTVTEKLNRACVGVVGCGGLGGYVIEYLLRLSIGHIKAADKDTYEESNLNRQLYSSPENLGKSKVQEAETRASLLNPSCNFEAWDCFIDEENAAEFVSGCDVIIDALDNAESRKILASACSSAGIPFVHGAISGWNLQVAAIAPGTDGLEKIYSAGVGKRDSTLPFTPAICAGYEVAEALKILLGEETEFGKLKCIDLLCSEEITIEI